MKYFSYGFLKLCITNVFLCKLYFEVMKELLFSLESHYIGGRDNFLLLPLLYPQQPVHKHQKLRHHRLGIQHLYINDFNRNMNLKGTA